MAKKTVKVHGVHAELVKRNGRVLLALQADSEKPMFEAQVERLIEVLAERLAFMRAQNEAPTGEHQRVRKPE